MVTCLTHREGGEVGELDTRGGGWGVDGPRRVGEGKVRAFCIHELAYKPTAVKRPRRFLFYLVRFYSILSRNVGTYV